ncbi:hypothetical protein IQ22_02083 [Pseudomonas duriflava]|uniref:DUF3298 domain-containing protein n=1 Tax=Pseudomonas duriflava TaxID=459528 RepID=A0A562QDH7_9PSED|nr:RsiV family protein [Pseudomonas duriflava]TWI54220.1 hypothetical protein IQ22_02083 [Pseudomonas duriflava]
MRLHKLFIVTAVAFLLSACQSLFGPNFSKPLEAEHIKWEHRPAGCTSSDCPFVNIDTLRFNDERLNAAIVRALLEKTRTEPDAPLPASLEAYEHYFLNRAQPGWSSYLQASIREQHDGLTIIELSSYLDTGGAHGMPGRGMLNYDRQQQKVLTLQDMLLPGQEGAFWKVAQTAHEAWLVANDLQNNTEFRKNWPFERTTNIALDFGSMTLKYDVSSLGPYAMGHPIIKIPYPRLNGILHPEYFPGRRSH